MIKRALKGLLTATLDPERLASLKYRLRRDRNSYYDLESYRILREVMSASAQGAFIDVGCHGGDFVRVLLKHLPGSRVVAFEPLPHLHDRLARRFGSLPSVQVVRCALSDRAGTCTFNHVVSNPGFSGMRKRAYDQPEVDEQIEVDTKRLDDVIDPSMPVRMIKIDVEGAELLVLKGARATLDRWGPTVVFEHGPGAADVYETTPETVFDFLRGLEYEIRTLSDRARRSAPLSREDFVRHFRERTEYYYAADKAKPITGA